MAIKGVNLAAKYVFESERDPDKGTEHAAKFTFKTLDAFQVAFLNDALMGFEGLGQDNVSNNASVRMGKVSLLAMQLSLISVENFTDPDTDAAFELKFKPMSVSGKSYMAVAPHVIAKFPGWLLQEAYGFIAEKNGMTAEDAKKSATP